MPALHATNTQNVIASLNAWFKTKANTLTVSLLTAPYTFVFAYPSTPITPPCFSTTHAMVSRLGIYQGRVLSASESGVSASNILDISAWVKNETNWQARMWQMVGIIEDVFAKEGSIQLSDYTTPGTPAAVTYKVNIGNLEFMQAEQDTANPGIMRQRVQVRYEWTLRTTVT